jgi:hypothetical protein
MKNLRLFASLRWSGGHKGRPTLPHYERFTFCLLFVVGLAMVACSSQSTTPAPTTPIPTTAPLQAVEEAIWAANEKDYDKANQLLDVSSLAQSTDPEGVTEHWNWLTSNQRVAVITIEEQETKEDARRLFITLQNDNYPTHTVGFWIRWQDDRWVAFEADN